MKIKQILKFGKIWVASTVCSKYWSLYFCVLMIFHSVLNVGKKNGHVYLTTSAEGHARLLVGVFVSS